MKNYFFYLFFLFILIIFFILFNLHTKGNIYNTKENFRSKWAGFHAPIYNFNTFAPITPLKYNYY